MTGGYGTGSLGPGPYGTLGGLFIALPHPVHGGYGGSQYGYSPYGSTQAASPPFPVSGGYGGSPYGTGPYGTSGTSFAVITASESISGFQIEVFFDEEMTIDTVLLDPASYTFTALVGAAPATALSVAVGVTGTHGATSVIITHTGTTLGGEYRITIVGPTNISGNPIEGNAPQNETELLTRGEAPAYTVNPVAGDEVILQFDQDMLPEADFSPGIEDTSAYEFTTTYPVTPIVQSVTHPVSGDLSRVSLELLGQTSASYTLTISPADAIVYDGTFHPDDATTFIGTEIGTGQSFVSAGGGLLLTKIIPNTYGWGFEDTSGRLIPGSSYRMDVTFDVSAAVITPPLLDIPFATIVGNDGAVEFIITLERVAGVDTVSVSSGVYSTSFSAPWSAQETTVSLVRNQKADIYSILVDGQPFASVLTGTPNGAPTIPNGVEFTIDPGGVYDITQLPLKSVLITATQTVFSAAWNFLHGQQFQFIGDDSLTKDSLFTDCGPLVKGWGDATPATEQDVSIKVNGIEVDVEDVNPYLGQIFPTIPIPLMPPGFMTVEVDYIYFDAPVLEFAELNNPGLVLNKWELDYNNTSPRFPFALALGPFDDLEDNRREPLQIGHRFIGYERAYTATLNTPTTLLLNENPHEVSRRLLRDIPPPEMSTLLFSKLLPPEQAAEPWTLIGTDTGGFEGITPLYILRDESSGSYGIGDVATYYREVNVSQPSSALISSWFFADQDEITFDGVFSGLAFGYHDNHNLYLVGCLVINGIMHVGLLTDLGAPELKDSWALAYTSDVVILDSKTMSVSQDALPEQSSAATAAGFPLRFQIFTGSQVGTYEAEEVVLQSDGTATITIKSTFPADPKKFGNRDSQAVFESRWDGTGITKTLTIYRLVVRSDIKVEPDGFAQLFIGSTLTGKALEVTGVPKLAIPPDTTLVLPTSEHGAVFWGSLSRRATTTSQWSFVTYSSTPNQTMFTAQGIVAAAEMNDLPEDDPNNIWFKTQEFGTSVIDSTADNMLLKSGAAGNQPGVENADLSYGYARIEPFFVREENLDLDARFTVESGVIGAGDVEIHVRDTERLIRLATIMYEEDPLEPDPLKFRRLVSMQTISLSGLKTITAQGWDLIDPGPQGPPTERVQQQTLTITQITDQRIIFTEQLDDTDIASDGRILEARLKFQSVTTGDPGGNTNIYIGADAGSLALPRSIGVRFRLPEGGNPARLVMFSPEGGTVVSTTDFTWNDGEYHDYRVVIDPDTDSVSLVVDDSVLTTEMFTAFDVATDHTRIQLGFVGADTNAVLDLDTMSLVVTPPDTVFRTLGVWLGGEDDDINNWELPRTDTLVTPNSTPGAVIEPMDWRSEIDLRIHRDPTWGVTILRPDLPPPPYFSGEFATQITEPSAGWINVEYRNLPRDRSGFGWVRFGALNPLSITQQRWNQVRYRIYPQSTEEFIPLPHAVLNQYNVITSGEFTDDISIETLVVTSTDDVTIDLKQTDITVARVFNLLFADENGQTVVINPEFFIFNPLTQIVTINTAALVDAGESPTELPAAQWPVTVNFAAGKPISKTYLCSQPFDHSKTILNEGTPPVPKSQVAGTTRQVAFGSRLNDPNDVLNDDPDFILNDPYRLVEFEDTVAELYDCLEFCEVDNGGETGLISPFCDAPIKGQGLQQISLSGEKFYEYGAQMPIPKEAPDAAQGACILDVTGPTLIDGTLNNCILQPISPNGDGLPMGPGGTVIWPVIGYLVDPATGAVQVLYFDRQAPPP